MDDLNPQPQDLPDGDTAERRANRQTRRSTLVFLRELLSLVLFALLLTIGCRLALEALFELTLRADFWLRDYMGNLVVTLLAWSLTRSRARAMALAAVVIVGFQMANGGKLLVLGTPISPDDFMNVQNLFYLTDGWRRAGLIVLAALPLIAMLALTRWRRASTWAVLASLGVALAFSAIFSATLRDQLDTRFGNSVWNQPENFRTRGLALHVAMETVRTMAKVGRHPDRAEVLAITQSMRGQNTRTSRNPAVEDEPMARVTDLSPIRTAASAHSGPVNASDQPLRNVHILVLESFFDAMTLGPEWVPEDPFPAAFRRLWAETGNSHALSPVFGGYTANAEFESLCGFPVTENAVFFEGWLRREVPCLPAVLADAGYQTVASHPNVPGFWNRTLAYRLVGFDQYLSKSDFDLTDSVDGQLLDHSFYDQVFARLQQQEDDRPLFNYLLTYHGHLPYPGNERYPDQVSPGRESVLLNGYLNHVWYKSRDLMQRLERLRSEDPDALIVIFGDHLPFLGPNYGVYDEALNLPADRADFSGEQLEILVSTPLIVIDGRHGPLKLGKLPLYRLPSLIMERLGLDPSTGILDWARTPEQQIIRPVYGMHFDRQDGETTACPDADEAPTRCHSSADWLARTRLLIQDLFTGRQYSLGELPATSAAAVDG